MTPTMMKTNKAKEITRACRLSVRTLSKCEGVLSDGKM